MSKPAKNSISKEDFFIELAKRSNSIPYDTIRDVYYSLVGIIINQFRSGNDIMLPELGKLSIFEKNHKYINFKNGVSNTVKIRQVKFSGCGSFKKYINEMPIKKD